MRVLIPSALRSYTAGQMWVEAEGGDLGELLEDLERRYPGFRFRMLDEQARIRRHIRVFAGGLQLTGPEARLEEVDEVLIVQALSGG